jgi:hypothetical protein
MKTLDQKRIALLERMGWTYHLDPSNEEMEEARTGTGRYVGAKGYPIGGGPLGGMQFKVWRDAKGVRRSLPSITHELCDEVRKFMNRAETEEVLMLYGTLLSKAADPKGGFGLSRLVAEVRHLSSEQDFLCQCQALEIE